MIIASVNLDLYCDAGHSLAEVPHQFVAVTREEAERAAALLGWSFLGDGRVLCPACPRDTTCQHVSACPILTSH